MPITVIMSNLTSRFYPNGNYRKSETSIKIIVMLSF